MLRPEASERKVLKADQAWIGLVCVAATAHRWAGRRVGNAWLQG